jgi:uncharacterized protein YyaL (SSP411 family)
MLTVFQADFRNDDASYNREAGKEGILSMKDNRETMRAFLRAYEATGNVDYLNEASSIAKMLLMKFRSAAGATKGLMLPFQNGGIIKPKPVVEDNLEFCIDLMKLGNYAKEDSAVFLATSTEIFKKIPADELTAKMRTLPLVIELLRYQNSEPFHAVWLYDEAGTECEIKVVRRLMLHRDPWLVIERKDLKNLSGDDKILYGGMEHGTLFMCTSTFCSSPIRSVRELEGFLK